jgi:hypothetical protein
MAEPNSRARGTIREHVKSSFRMIISSLPEMRGREFHFGLVPQADAAGNAGLGLERQEWSLVVAKIIQSLMVGHGYPVIPVGQATSATWRADLTTGIDAVVDLISEKLES